VIGDDPAIRVDSGMYAATVDQAAGAAVHAEARGDDGWRPRTLGASALTVR
jgi:hypothetical protein